MNNGQPDFIRDRLPVGGSRKLGLEPGISNGVKRLDRLIEFSLLALIFTLPFSKSMVEIFFIVALIGWVLKRAAYCYSATPRISPLKVFAPVSTELNLPITIFAFFGFLSMLTSVSFILSMEGFFFKLFEWIMLYFIVAETVNDDKKLNRFLLVVLASMTLMGIDGLFQHITGTDFLRKYYAGDRIRGSFDSANGFAAWLIVMFPLALSLAFSKIGNWFGSVNRRGWFKVIVKLLLLFLSLLLLLCLAWTLSRSGWLAGFLALVFLGIFGKRKVLIITMVILLILPFAATVSIKNRADTIMEISKANDVRFPLWHEAMNITADFPLLGSGLNTYASIAPRYKLTEETGYYPHNCYLQMAAESGVLGLGAFLWILITLFRISLMNIKRINDKFCGAVLAGLLAGLFGLLVHSFFDVDIYSLQLGNLMWFIMGLIVAVQKVSLRKNL